MTYDPRRNGNDFICLYDLEVTELTLRPWWCEGERFGIYLRRLTVLDSVYFCESKSLRTLERLDGPQSSI